MPKRIPMLGQIAAAISKADSGNLNTEGDRYRRHSLAVLKPLMRPTDAVVEADHAAVSFGDLWAINSHANFRKAVKAMIFVAMKERSE